MFNKDTTFEEFKHSVITPSLVDEALDNLPSNYIVQAQELIEQEISKGNLTKNFSKNWIVSVKKRDEFNQDIMNVLVFIGLKNQALKNQYGVRKEKAPSTIK